MKLETIEETDDMDSQRKRCQEGERDPEACVPPLPVPAPIRLRFPASPCLSPSTPVAPSLIFSSSLHSPCPSPSAAAGPSLVLSSSGKTLLLSSSGKALGVSNSGKRIDQKKKYVKQVTGRHNDTDLHLAAKRGDLAAVRQILGEIDAQMVGTANAADFDAEVAEIRSAVVNEVNELGETALFAAAEAGYVEIVKELLKFSDKESISRKNQSGFDALHKAASQGHQRQFLHRFDIPLLSLYINLLLLS
ncbi:hypothetical protein ACLOJK_028083 [Asimina triloba]